MRVLDDGDVFGALSMADAVATVADAFREQAAGTLVAPPRFTVDAGEGNLVFTAGTARERGVTGVRIYETFPPDAAQTQLTAVWSSETGAFRGLHAGHAVAGLRTGAIGGVAVDCLARADAATLGVLGSGPQSRLQATAVDAVRDLDRVQVYSPTPDHRAAYVDDVDDRVACPVRARGDPEPVVREADVLVVATDSAEPTFEAGWVQPGTHVSTLGPKRASAHEIPLDLLGRADAVATDSLAQVADEPAFFLPDPASEVVELGDAVAGDLPDRTDDAVTVFCSVGLAGTEVVLADEALARTG
ncbi:MAG: ornithine cyclodeaminase family protein [Haloarculaceae archaeon]